MVSNQCFFCLLTSLQGLKRLQPGYGELSYLLFFCVFFSHGFSDWWETKHGFNGYRRHVYSRDECQPARWQVIHFLTGGFSRSLRSSLETSSPRGDETQRNCWLCNGVKPRILGQPFVASNYHKDGLDKYSGGCIAVCIIYIYEEREKWLYAVDSLKSCRWEAHPCCHPLAIFSISTEDCVQKYLLRVYMAPIFIPSRVSVNIYSAVGHFEVSWGLRHVEAA